MHRADILQQTADTLSKCSAETTKKAALDDKLPVLTYKMNCLEWNRAKLEQEQIGETIN